MDSLRSQISRPTRREFLERSTASCLALSAANALADDAPKAHFGRVVGQREAALAGERVLAAGGNAVDAIVTAALVAAVVSPSNCGIGGYGGHLVLGFPGGKITAIDFNSAAPAAARPDMFPVDARGNVRGAINQHGWLAAGVPGTLAGFQLALDRFGTLRLERAIEPAIRYARDGFVLDAGQARAIKAAWPQLQRDPASARLFAPDCKPLVAGQTLCNPDLAVLLERLAKDNSVATFYRDDIADHIAREFKKHDGLVTAEDLAKYEPREVLPLSLEWRGVGLHTAPLTAGGLSVLQAMATLKALSWQNEDAADPRSTHAFVEALRLAWHDRLTMLGDPTGGDDPSPRLLSMEYATQAAERVRQAIREKRLIPGKTDSRAANGTIHLSAADNTGVMAALTLTHGEGFGARVTVDGLGLVLGHGMSRFEPRPGHPNSIRPFRRPLNNMCPTIVFRGDQAVLAAGATGGRRIPNTMYSVLVDYAARDSSLTAAYAVPRLHTEGDALLQLGKDWKNTDTAYLKQVGYSIENGTGANLNAIARDPADGLLTVVPQ